MFSHRESIPNKPIEECKTLSIVIEKDEQAFCWVVYKNHSYRKSNLGLTAKELIANEDMAKEVQQSAVKAAKQLCERLNAQKQAQKPFLNKQIRLERLLDALNNM